MFKTQSIILSWWLVYGDSRWRFWIMKISNKLGSITPYSGLEHCLLFVWSGIMYCTLYILWHSQTICLFGCPKSSKSLDHLSIETYWNIWFSGSSILRLPHILTLFPRPVDVQGSRSRWLKAMASTCFRKTGGSCAACTNWPWRSNVYFLMDIKSLGDNENQRPGIEYISWISFQIGGFTPTEESWIVRRLKPP